MKITKLTSGNGILYRIEDVDHDAVVLDPEEALVVLHFLYEELDELSRLSNESDAGETDPPGRELPADVGIDGRLLPPEPRPRIWIDRHR